ncbi:MAG: hypothetical protein CMJ64_08450 [Planctomycetaceae bacterium]|nr:hypothetical protein [Planctomycetaceae bacterium]
MNATNVPHARVYLTELIRSVIRLHGQLGLPLALQVAAHRAQQLRVGRKDLNGLHTDSELLFVVPGVVVQRRDDPVVRFEHAGRTRLARLQGVAKELNRAVVILQCLKGVSQTIQQPRLHARFGDLGLGDANVATCFGFLGL